MGPYYPRVILRHMIDIGYYSLPVVGLTAIFTGMVLALQTHTGFSRFEAESAVATVVVLSMTRELGPVLAGLMVAGRVGASMAAELGTMRVTEQIGVVPFVDGGTVYQEAYPDFSNTFRWAAGLGLRYFTGFGPVRLDVAFPINRREVDRRFQFYISVGQAF